MHNRAAASPSTATEALPPEYDPAYYRKRHFWLSLLPGDLLAKNYEQNGRRKGRMATAAAARENFLRLLPKNGDILEIGPFASPVSKSPNTHYFDVLDKAGLAARAQQHGLPTLDIPDVQYVSESGDLGIVDKPMDCVVSSHCIEHQPDLIKHLQLVERILKPGGRYFLLIPDKRYCFDHYLPETAVDEVLDAHREKRTVHTLASVIAHEALTTHGDSQRHWAGDHYRHDGPFPGSRMMIERAIKIFEDAKGAYIDVHSLQFTPDSFRKMMKALFDNGHTRLYPVRVYDTPYGRLEFCAVLEVQS